MKFKFLLICFSAAATLNAQKSSRLFYVTDQAKGGYNWSAIRTVSAGMAEQVVMNNAVAKGVVVDAGLQKKKADYSPNAGNYNDQPMYSGVAALAYDQQHDRLYFATMFTQQLRYVELSDREAGRYYDAANLTTIFKSKQPLQVSAEQQGPVVTRMTIGGDGYGYGLSNDGQSFFRFTLDKKTQVTALGSLLDDEKNGGVSVHNACSSWGGDIIASEQGDLYLFTMRQLVFKINPATRIATYLGTITGLDNNFTINGAAVNDDGKVLLSTAAYAGSRGILSDMNNLVAVEEKGADYYNASDLASSNLLFSKKATKEIIAATGNQNDIQLFPNPAVNGFTILQFEKSIAGRLNIDVLSGAGSTMIRKPVQITIPGQQVKLNTNSLAKGLYVIRVVDASRKEIYTNKLVVQ
jgi:hypothetical protein